MPPDHGTDPTPIDPGAPTPYPDVNAVLGDLRPRVQDALGKNLVGMYLFGSLVTGDFDPRRSDVDVLVVTHTDVSAEQFAALQAAHQAIATSDSPWAIEVEAYYLTRAALRRGDPSFGAHLKVNRGGGILEPLHRDPGWLIQSHLFRAHGVALIGPDPRTLVDPMAPGDLRRASAASQCEWLEALLADPSKLRPTGPHAYLVLTLCRVLYTLEHDAVAPKQAAGHWAQTALGERWSSLIGLALAWRKDLRRSPRAATSDHDLAETLELIRYVLARCHAE